MGTSPLVRVAQPDDSLRIWEIKNNPLTRQASINQDEVPWEKHKSWFHQKYIVNKANSCFVLDHDGNVAGYCRFDSEKDSFRVSIALDPVHHGQGLGSLFLAEASAQFGKDRSLTAEVKKNNYPSVQIFKKAGFHITNEDSEYFYFERHAQ